MAFEDLVEKQDLKVGITFSRANASIRLRLPDDLDYYEILNYDHNWYYKFNTYKVNISLRVLVDDIARKRGNIVLSFT